MAGALLGIFFFGGLWWTIRKGLASRSPALWFLGSIVIRTAVVVAGFYFVSGGAWDRILACLLGFIVARFVIIRRRRSREVLPDTPKINES
jgi:F1F0 ATPase subunit 2